MDWSIRDNRHVALIALIIAAIPMLVYPNSFGVTFQMESAWYVLLEVTYFFAVGLILYRRRTVAYTALAALLTLAGRALLSAVFMALLMSLEQMPARDAFLNGFESFKPALLLFSVTAPFLYGSAIGGILPGRMGRHKLRKLESTPIIYTSTSTPVMQKPAPMPTPPATTQPDRSLSDFRDRSFAGAIQHVGSYSGVKCAMLIDAEGLPVASWSRDNWDQEMWSALAKRIVDDVTETNARAGTIPLDTIEFKSGGQRFCLYRAADMWLLSIADAESDELEQIRLHQAAEMIERYCQEKFSNVYSSETGRKYAGSTV
jgi:predicted regulator of Ras-like GTPase activity (Roadblock/LC7/MglB family)